MLKYIQKQQQIQKIAKINEQKKWDKQNQLNTLKQLIDQPKQFIHPKLNQINEENEVNSPKINIMNQNFNNLDVQQLELKYTTKNIEA